MSTIHTSYQCAGWRGCFTGKIIEILRDLPEVDGEGLSLSGSQGFAEEPEPMLRQEIEEALAGKKYRLARIVSAYRQEERVEKGG